MQWSRSCLNVPIPATLFSVSLNRFFFFSPFNALGMFSFILTQLVLILLIMHLDHYIFSALVRSFILEKGFQELLICILAKLRARKNPISYQDMSLLWNSSIFFNVSRHHDKQHTVHNKIVLFYNQHPPVTHGRNLNSCLLFLGVPPKYN